MREPSTQRVLLPRKQNPARLITSVGILAIIVAAIVGPFASHPDYSSLRHSLSELAGQNMPNAWIMRSGFTAFGGAVLAASMMRLRTSPAVFSALAAFGCAMLGSAVWSHLPILASLGGSVAEDHLHSIAASGMGFAFAAACAARLWTLRKHGLDRLSAFALIMAVVIPLCMVLVPTVAGAVQRLMFLMSFVWILNVLGAPNQMDGTDRDSQ